MEGTPEKVITGSPLTSQFLSTGHILTVHFHTDEDGITDDGVEFEVDAVPDLSYYCQISFKSDI